MNLDLPAAVASFFDGSKAGDPDVWAARFTDDADIHDPVGQPPLTGRAALRDRMAGFLPYFTRFSGLLPTHAYQAGDSTAVRWTATATMASGQDLSWAGITVFTLDDDDMICRLQAFFDASVFA
jgi:steroid delta-isomerase